MFWSDVGTHKLSYCQCLWTESQGRCGEVVDLVSDLGADSEVDGLAMDPVNQRLYWTDAGRRRIEAMRIPAGPRTVLVQQDLDSPRAMTLHLRSRYNY